MEDTETYRKCRKGETEMGGKDGRRGTGTRDHVTSVPIIVEGLGALSEALSRHDTKTTSETTLVGKGRL